jgi:hypothetical protein
VPEDYFNTVLYTGNGSTQSITGVGFQPDFTWLKSRSVAYGHQLFDVARGATKRLSSNVTDAEVTNANSLTAFNSDGFSLGTDAGINSNSATYVSWNWLAGNGTSSNTDGTITSTVSANQKAGFSIVSYTGNGLAGTSSTIGHGLGVAPELVIFKSRTDALGWWVWLSGYDSTTYLELNSTQPKRTDGGTYGASNATSTTLNVGRGDANSWTNGSVSDTFVAYFFASIEGFSKIGSYTGNGSTDGPFVYTGFRPAFVIVKRTDLSTNGHWIMMDSTRKTYNVIDSEKLFANTTPSESGISGDDTSTDFLSNGFKLRGTYSGINGSGSSYIYIAFAEMPFKYSNAR